MAVHCGWNLSGVWKFHQSLSLFPPHLLHNDLCLLFSAWHYNQTCRFWTKLHCPLPMSLQNFLIFLPLLREMQFWMRSMILEIALINVSTPVLIGWLSEFKLRELLVNLICHLIVIMYSDRNQISRLVNSACTLPTSPLTPLVNAATGNPIAQFPATVAVINAMAGESCIYPMST